MPTGPYSDGQRRVQALLREARTAAGLTQADVAARLRRPQSFVSKYESGERRLDILELQGVCEAFGITLGEFVRRLEGQQPR
jgi:transcriptional regulator with XRE-family HTH domain